jgi:hypothetical protein
VSKLTPVAMVIDRPTAARVAADMKELGGAWLEMFDTWRRSDMPFLVMLAHTEQRIRLRAPLTAMAVDEAALRKSLKVFCQQLIGMRCRWALCLEPGSPAEQLVRNELLLDFATEGNA